MKKRVLILSIIFLTSCSLNFGNNFSLPNLQTTSSFESSSSEDNSSSSFDINTSSSSYVTTESITSSSSYQSSNSSSSKENLPLKTLTLDSKYAKESLSQYSTGNFGNENVNNTNFEFYRAYRKENLSYIITLLGNSNSSFLPSSFYNTTPLYGIRSINIEYKSLSNSYLYSSKDKQFENKYTLIPSSNYSNITLEIDDDNFFKIESSSNDLTINSISINYTDVKNSYNNSQNKSNTDYRINPITYQGTLIDGKSYVNIPTKIVNNNGKYQIVETKKLTYYSFDYIKKNSEYADEACLTEPSDIASYFAAFKRYPANFIAKNFYDDYITKNNTYVSTIFGDKTRYVSRYNRVNGYVNYVPYSTEKKSNPYYYEFDIDIDSTYSLNSRGVGRVVSWEDGWIGSNYDTSPVSVYTDDHYCTFQEYLNYGSFGTRFDAQSNRTNYVHNEPNYINL